VSDSLDHHRRPRRTTDDQHLADDLPPPADHGSRRSGLLDAARSRPVVAVAAAVAVVAALGIAGTALIRKAKSPDKVDTIAAGEHLAAVLDQAATSGRADSGQCPFPDIRRVLEAAPSPPRPEGWSADSVVGGFSNDQRRLITCMGDGDRLRADSVKLGVVIGEPRSVDLRAALTVAAGDDQIKFGSGFRLHGGEALSGCVSGEGQQVVSYCVAAYNGVDLAIDVVAGGPAATAESMTTWLRDAFADIVAAIEAAPLKQPASATSSTSISTDTSTLTETDPMATTGIGSTPTGATTDPSELSTSP